MIPVPNNFPFPQHAASCKRMDVSCSCKLQEMENFFFNYAFGQPYVKYTPRLNESRVMVPYSLRPQQTTVTDAKYNDYLNWIPENQVAKDKICSMDGQIRVQESLFASHTNCHWDMQTRPCKRPCFESADNLSYMPPRFDLPFCFTYVHEYSQENRPSDLQQRTREPASFRDALLLPYTPKTFSPLLGRPEILPEYTLHLALTNTSYAAQLKKPITSATPTLPTHFALKKCDTIGPSNFERVSKEPVEKPRRRTAHNGSGITSLARISVDKLVW